jgi:NhaA family Na+:H+ antiporter
LIGRGHGPTPPERAPGAPPEALTSRLTQSLRAFLHAEAAGGLVLLAATACALAWSNGPAAESYHHLREIPLGFELGGLPFRMSVEHWINDGLMALFFFVVGLEIKREILVGELASPRRAALPVAAAVGGAVLPALLYLVFNHDGPHAAGWGVPMATDIAFAVGILAILGSGVPDWLKTFLVALAITDDLIAVAVIALFYTSGVSTGPLLLAGGLLAAMVLLNIAGIRRPVWFLLLAIALWAAVLASGVHATVAGVAAAATIPARDDPTRDRPEAPLAGLEHRLLPWTTYLVLPLFALVNAGVAVRGSTLALAATSPISIGVLVALVLGKPLGILGASWLACSSGLARLPEGGRWSQLAGAACLGGIGFTMSIFIGSLAFPEGELLDLARIAVLAGSVVSAAAGYVALRISGSGRAERPA